MLFLCYSNGMDHLVHTFIDKVTLFISQNDQLNINQSGFRSGHSIKTALLSVTIALQWKLIPNHQFLFCWIYLPLLTLWIIRSQDLHSTGLNLISQVGLSGFPGQDRYPKNISWSQGFLRDQFLDPSSSPYTLHHWDPAYRHMVSPTIAMLMTHSSIIHFNQTIQ